ncbi:glycoside hydrolase family 13 domain protein [Desulfobulbus propionicus DSM 2032]|jgi:hypothetical protein|uniref:Glycoside hydrolase family 13 domain protein n=1 Tax=Desulfobulbus propionicus (strain ATCC 33891 / DSM 2032 / VKM B-1956 / 1pr3) TaxID=577650 RepID=A0A7U3YL48_DESPD|nr:glycoside hydrolase [Desulfobulbus propionicus]ADW17365.1 glycoside hydrolase family 13 domain protein [Desulfobulbus propionicus DSM 2032]
MIRLLLIVPFVGLLGGCAPQHTAVVHDDTVTLTLRAPKAATVRFASSIDRFAVHHAARNREGTWLVSGLPNIEFQYFYLVDGQVMVPDCRFKVSDDFGSVNCRNLP